MRDPIWRIVERRVRRAVPVARAHGVLGDLAEDYARRQAARGRVRSSVWLLSEGRSLTRAYRAPAPSRLRHALMLADDFRHAARRLVTRPGRPVLCASLLALGIGLATAMFSVVDSTLFRPAPFPFADRTIEQTMFDPEPALMEAWTASGLFETVEAAQRTSFQSDRDGALPWAGARVTSGTFEMLGVRVLHGRLPTREDARSASDAPILISERLWRSGLGGDSSIVGTQMSFKGVQAVVIGVLPAAFRFPTPATVIWQPFEPSSAPIAPTMILGRLREGVPFQTAEDRVKQLAAQHGRIPSHYIGAPPVRPIGDGDIADLTRRGLYTLLVGVALVFVVLCANVASLLLADLSARRREFGMCAALGASRGRLLRRVATEHALVAGAGVAVGIALAWMLTAMVPDLFQGRTLNAVDLDLRALFAAAAFGIASVLLTGVVPAWLGTRGDPITAIRSLRDAGTDTRTSRMFSRALLIGEIGLACSLLVGAGLLVRSFANLTSADRGLAIEGIMRVSVGGMDDAFGSGEAMALGAEAIERRFAGWSAVDRVALSRELPPGLGADGLAHLGPPGTKPDSSEGMRAELYRVSPAFLALHDIPVVRGRGFSVGDADTDAIVSERLARLLWPGSEAVGQTFAWGTSPSVRRVIGVAREIRLPTLDSNLDLPELYTPMGRLARTLFVSFRCRVTCPSEAEVRAQILAVHPGLRARLTTASDDAYASQLTLSRATAKAAGVFAIVAVLTAAGGLFAVLTHAVGRRRREFGIRSALGASPGGVQWLIFRDAFSIVSGGAVLGGFGGWLAARALSSLHYGVTPADPLTWVGVIGTLVAASVAAAWRPARQAMRVDPVKLLREE